MSSPNHGEGVQATGPISESPASEEQAEAANQRDDDQQR